MDFREFNEVIFPPVLMSLSNVPNPLILFSLQMSLVVSQSLVICYVPMLTEVWVT